jgi:hypothetical protein
LLNAENDAMEQSPSTFDVYVEIGQKRTFAGAVDWPGWCRIGRDEASAKQALFDYSPRYAHVLHAAQIPFQPPSDPSALVVVERLAGNATTDFGAPDIAPSSDTQPIDEAELQRLLALLMACWQVFDTAVRESSGKPLRKGPRGGGRELEAIVQHVLAAERGYLARLAWKEKPSEEPDLTAQLERTRQAMLKALTAAAQGDLPTRGPRGGIIWQPRYFVRRVAWHVLDHTWELEDRVL